VRVCVCGGGREGGVRRSEEEAAWIVGVRGASSLVLVVGV
jgi:hypothetical protein